MALIQCPECGREVSTAAKACPACGYPVAEASAQQAPQPSSRPEELLVEVRPSWWGYFWWLLFAWLIIPFFVAWFKRRATVMRVYTNRVTLELGIFSKCYREIFMRDIRSIDIDQSFVQRMAAIGDISISSSATSDATLDVDSVPDPGYVRDMIIAQRQKHQSR